MIDPIDYNRPLPPEVLADAMHDTVHCGPTPFPPACEECGHIRYETDLHSGHCPVCELWAENEIRALRAEVERLKVAEGEAMLVVESQDASIAALKAKYETPLTDEQAERAFAIAKENGVGECDTLAHGVQGIDAAIRRVRGER